MALSSDSNNPPHPFFNGAAGRRRGPGSALHYSDGSDPVCRRGRERGEGCDGIHLFTCVLAFSRRGAALNVSSMSIKMREIQFSCRRLTD